MDIQVKLRRLHQKDAPVLATLANNKNVWDNLRDLMPHPYAEKDAIDFIEMVDKEDPHCTFALEFENELCGVIGLMLQKDVYRFSGEIGYWIGEPYWGRGIASHGIKMILEYGFTQLNLSRIFAGAYEYNMGSMRVLEKNGFEKEGVLKKAVFKNGEFYDEHRFGILNPNFKTN